MKMNIFILRDVLAKYGAEIFAPNSTVLNLEGVRYLPKHVEHWSTEYMYAVSAQELISAGYRAQTPSLSFLCRGRIDTAMLAERGWHAIIVPDEVDYRDVFDAVQNAFKFYRKWDEKLSAAIMAGCSVQEFMDIASEVFTAPMALFDGSGTFMFSSGDRGLSQLPDVWESLEQKGFFSPEIMNREEYQFLYANLSASHVPFSLWISQRKNNNLDVWAPLVDHDNSLIGSIALIGYSSLSYGQMSLLGYIQDRFGMVCSKLSNYQNLFSEKNDNIINLEANVALDQPYILNSLPANWHVGDRFTLLVLRPEDERGSRALLSNIIPQLRPFFADAVFFVRSQEMIIMTRGSVTERAFSNTRHILNSSGLYAAVSDQFSDPSSLEWAYSQCLLLLLDAKTPMEERISWFSRRYSSILTRMLGWGYNPLNLCKTTLLEYVAVGGKKRLETVHSLLCYLRSGGNYSSAAEMIGIHRNTLKQRLEKLERLMDMDFSALDEQEFLALYISCVIIEQQLSEEREK